MIGAHVARLMTLDEAIPALVALLSEPPRDKCCAYLARCLTEKVHFLAIKLIFNGGFTIIGDFLIACAKKR